MEPDRWAEERRRGLTIDLGFAWTGLPGGGQVAFVDVPGHERVVPNMLAGGGPVPAVLFVVAADEGWRAQSAEHLAALDALSVRHGLLAVTRSDLADPVPALADAAARIARTTLGAVPALAVSGSTGAGLGDPLAGLAVLVSRPPGPAPRAPVRPWVGRSFATRGAGTVVTGTLPAGTLRVGDELDLPGTGTVRIRGLQALARPETAVTAVARVAVNLRALDHRTISRGDALLTPGAWHLTSTVDVALRPAAVPTDQDPPLWTQPAPGRPSNERTPDPDPRGMDSTAARKPAEPPAEVRPGPDPLRMVGAVDLPTELVLHVGSAAVPVRVRPLGAVHARLALARPLPLRAGDRGLLRDPGRHRIVAGVRVLDVAPPPLSRRGAAAPRGAELAAAVDDQALALLVLRHRGFATAAELSRLGLPAAGLPVGGAWLADESRWTALKAGAGQAYEDWHHRHPLAAGMPTDALRRTLDLP